MKTYLTFSILVAMAIAAAAAPQKTFTAPAVRAAPPPKPPPVLQPEGNGVLQRATRGGNPIQMLNPKAPAKYGTSQQSVVFNYDTGKCEGIKLIEIIF